MASVSGNIRKMYVIKILTWFMVMIPVIVPFYQENGLSLQEVLIVQAFFAISLVIFEIPSGYFADVYGRKRAMVLGSVLSFGGYLLYCYSTSFYQFLFAEFWLGVGCSFLSGADSALIYESLLQRKLEGVYQQVEGRFQAMGSFSEAVASVLGGFIAVVSLRYTVYAQAIIYFLAIPFTLSLVEPKAHHEDLSVEQTRGIWKVVKYSLHGHKEVKWLILFGALIGSATFNVVWFVQPYFEQVGLPLIWFGVVWAVFQVSVGVFSLFAHRVEQRWGERRSLLLLLLIPLLAYLSTGFFYSLWALPLFLLFYFTRGIKGPVLRDYVNKLVPSAIRATVLSVESMCMRMIFVFIGPVAGWIADQYGLPASFYGLGLFFGVAGGISLLMLSRYRAL